VTGSLRFISHQEMLRLWQRALVRADVPVCFSEGYNPHPKISLPLPRSVGLEADDEIVCVCVEYPEGKPPDLSQIKTSIGKQLPEGCSLTQVEVYDGKTSLQPGGAVYFVPVQVCQKVRTAVDNLLLRLGASERITVGRRIDKSGSSRTIDASEYIKAIYIKDNGVLAECRISPAGSIRVDEIMGLLQIDVSMLTGPVRRTSVQWLQKN
jgi:radical SAM-linked protein